MAEIRDKLILDTSQPDRAFDGLKGKIGATSDVAEELRKEIERLNKKAILDAAKAASDEYRQALDRAAKAAKGLEKASDGASRSGKSLGESFFTTANQATQLAKEVIAAGKAVHEFAMAGVDASRVAKQFTGDLAGLRAASGNAVDDTTLQRLDIAARRLNMWGHEVEAFTRLATKLAREGGQEMADVFQQLIDASPEQLEKWGVLTSELTEELKGLDTVQQKQALRQALVNEGMQITNAEIAEQTSNVERLGTRWDNWVSDVQAGTAAIIESDGFNHALEEMGSTFDGIGDSIVSASGHLTDFLAEMGKPLGIEDVGITDLFDLFWYQTVIGPIHAASEAYQWLENQMSSGVVVKGARDAAKAALLAEEAARNRAAGAASIAELDEMLRELEANSTVPATRNQVSADRTETFFAETPEEFDFTRPGALNDPKPRGRKRKRGTGLSMGISGLFGVGQDAARFGATADERAALAEEGIGSFDDAGSALFNAFSDDKEGLQLDVLQEGLNSARDMFAETADEIARNWDEKINGLRAEAAERFAVHSAESIGNAYLGMLSAVSQGGESFREQMMNVLGELWGQLSAGFLAWATAEGNLLAGNPFGAIAAAVALGAIGSVISSIGSRGSSGGTGNTNAQRFNERERERREEQPETELTVNLVGIPVPDKTARELADAIDRNLLLRGAA